MRFDKRINDHTRTCSRVFIVAIARVCCSLSASAKEELTGPVGPGLVPSMDDIRQPTNTAE